MPKFLGVGVNQQTYTMAFSNAKQGILVFDKAFSLKPSIQVTLGDTGSAPACRTLVTTTGCTIKLQNNWTGQLDVSVTERANNN